MKSPRGRIAVLLSVLTLEGILITDPIRPWLPFSLWTIDAEAISIAGILAFLALALAGGILPFTFPGLRPLPLTFPLIGACLLLYGLPPAAGLAALTALIAHGMSVRNDEEPRASWAATLAGTGAGLLVADLSGYVLPQEPWVRGALEMRVTLTAGLLLSAAALAAVLIARRLGADPRSEGPEADEERRDLLLALVAAPVAAGLALAAAQAVRIWGLGPVALWLAAPFAAMAPVAAALSRARRETHDARRRTAGITEILEAVALAIEAKDQTSAHHLRRMRTLARSLGRRLGMSAAELERLDVAALLHDIGKLAVPEWILSKPGRLNDEEFQKMTVHSETGARILEAVPAASGVAPIIRHHHEHYDGSGYPSGLSGLAIPIGSRILAVVDAFEAITSDRSYHRAIGREEALKYLGSKSGILFDPRVVRTLIAHFAEIQAEVDAAVAAAGAPEGAVAAGAEGGAGLSIQNVLDTIASSHLEVYSLHEIGQALGKALDLEESLSLIAGRLGRLFHFAACAVYVVDPEREVLVPRLTAGVAAERLRQLEIPIGSGVSGWAAKEGRSLIGSPPQDPILRDGTRSDLDSFADDAEIRALESCVVAPVMSGQEVVGVIALYDTAANRYTAAEEKLLAMVGRQVGPAVRNGLLHERTQEHTLTDSITGLPNTRFMFVAMDQALGRARETGEALSILVMDLDGFSMVNDEFGHPAGDRYLFGVSRAIRGQMRDRDVCVRYSGDEFVAILPGVGREEALQVAERIRRAVAEFSLEGRAGRRIRLDVSVGHACFGPDGEEFEALFSAADERLAREKVGHRARALSGGKLVPFKGPRTPGSSN